MELALQPRLMCEFRAPLRDSASDTKMDGTQGMASDIDFYPEYLSLYTCTCITAQMHVPS